MRIVIDGSSLLPPRTGIGFYTYYLVQELIRLDEVNQYTIFLNSLRRPVPAEVDWTARGNVRVRRWRIPGSWLLRGWQRAAWPPLRLLAGRGDVVHAPAGVMPPTGGTPLVATLADVYFARCPGEVHSLGGRYLSETLGRRVNECAAVICMSEFTRREAIEVLGLEEKKAWVAPLGVDMGIFRPLPEGEVEEKRRAWNLPREFLIYAATIEPRKNVEGTLRIMARLKEMMPDAPKLVWAGGKGFGVENLRERVRELGLVNDVVFIGHVSREQLAYLYNMAQACIMPSKYEGFGLPVVEAMACGRAVIASQADALREVGGDAAVYAPHDDAEAYAEAIREVLLSARRRTDLARAGLARAARFSWRETARQTLAVYEAVAREHGVSG